MKTKCSKNELECMADLISTYISENECKNIIEKDCDCENCGMIEECYILANDKCNSEWAKSVDYGGCDTEEEFWEQIFD